MTDFIWLNKEITLCIDAGVTYTKSEIKERLALYAYFYFIREKKSDKW